MQNSVNLTGRLTADIELKQTASGIPAVNFTLAVQRDFKNANGEYDTDFFSCIAFRGTAEFAAKYFNKGCFMPIVGRLQTRKYTAKDGTNRTVTEIVVSSITYVGGKKPENTAAESQQTPYVPAEPPQGFVEDGSEEDLPF